MNAAPARDTWVVGDVQGCDATLGRLLDEAGFDPARDHLVLLGDLVNRGPASVDVLRRVRALGEAATALIGNHEVYLLGRAAGAVGRKKRDTLAAILDADDADALIDWVRARPLVWRAAGWLGVHAGLRPGWDADATEAAARRVESALRGPDWAPLVHDVFGPKRSAITADLDILTRVRMYDAAGAPAHFDGPPEDAPPGLVPWYAQPRADRDRITVLFGHWAAHGHRSGRGWVSLDTGCVWGRTLTAIRLRDREVLSIPVVDRLA